MFCCVSATTSPSPFPSPPQVPVTSWFDDPNDTELLDLIPFFEALDKVDNVLTVLSRSQLHTPSPTSSQNDPNSQDPQQEELWSLLSLSLSLCLSVSMIKMPILSYPTTAPYLLQHHYLLFFFSKNGVNLFLYMCF